MKIAFVNGKGGVGKSTLCYLIALALKEGGQSVLVQDYDPQKAISSWIKKDRDQINLNQGQGTFLLIDTRPALDDPTIREAVEIADRIILPCTPSPGDLTAIPATISLCRKFKQEEAKIMLALNMVKANTTLASIAPDVLQDFGIHVCSHLLGHRQCIQRAVSDGWNALDPDTKEAVFNLALEVTA